MPRLTPVLTVGIPAYNEEKFLLATLHSIAGQTFRDFVVHICDDCSTDNTLSIANDFAANDKRFNVWPSKNKTTFTENWARSLEMCESKYFTWIGAHDLLDPGYFEEAVSKLNADDTVAMVYPRSISIDVNGNRGEPMDSDIETNDVSEDSIIKVARNLSYCTAIHGVFRAIVLKNILMKRIIGFDYLILFVTSVHGKIKPTGMVRFFRRVVRVESSGEAIERWRKSGMFEKTDDDPFAVLVAFCVREFNKAYKGSVVSRLMIGQKLVRIFAAKHNLSVKEILRVIIRQRAK